MWYGSFGLYLQDQEDSNKQAGMIAKVWCVFDGLSCKPSTADIWLCVAQLVVYGKSLSMNEWIYYLIKHRHEY